VLVSGKFQRRKRCKPTSAIGRRISNRGRLSTASLFFEKEHNDRPPGTVTSSKLRRDFWGWSSGRGPSFCSRCGRFYDRQSLLGRSSDSSCSTANHRQAVGIGRRFSLSVLPAFRAYQPAASRLDWLQRSRALRASQPARECIKREARRDFGKLIYGPQPNDTAVRAISLRRVCSLGGEFLDRGVKGVHARELRGEGRKAERPPETDYRGRSEFPVRKTWGWLEVIVRLPG